MTLGPAPVVRRWVHDYWLLVCSDTLQQRCTTFLGQGPQRIIFNALEGRKTKLLAELSRVAYKKANIDYILLAFSLLFLVWYCCHQNCFGL